MAVKLYGKAGVLSTLQLLASTAANAGAAGVDQICRWSVVCVPCPSRGLLCLTSVVRDDLAFYRMCQVAGGLLEETRTFVDRPHVTQRAGVSQALVCVLSWS